MIIKWYRDGTFKMLRNRRKWGVALVICRADLRAFAFDSSTPILLVNSKASSDHMSRYAIENVLSYLNHSVFVGSRRARSAANHMLLCWLYV